MEIFSIFFTILMLTRIISLQLLYPAVLSFQTQDNQTQDNQGTDEEDWILYGIIID